MRLILHIGTERTGAANFQKQCFAELQKLRENGVWYSEAAGGVNFKPNHRKLAVYAQNFNKDDDGFSAHYISTEEEHSSFRSSVESDLREEFETAKQTNCHTFFLSCEHLHARLKNETGIRRLHDLLHSICSEITVLVHLRPQIEVAICSIANGAAFGSPVNPSAFDKVNVTDPYYNYLESLNLWAKVFGKQSITPVPFQRAPNISSFLDEYLPPTFPFIEYDVSDSSVRGLDVDAISILNNLNSRNAEAISYFLSAPLFEPLRIGIGIATKVQARFYESNARLAIQYNSLVSSDFIPDWTEHLIPSNFDKLDGSKGAAAHVQHILTMSKNALLEQKFETLLTSSERALARGNVMIAKELFLHSQSVLDLAVPTAERYRLSKDVKDRIEDCRIKTGV